MPIIALLPLLEAIWGGIGHMLEALFDRIGFGAAEMWHKFPNPIGMLDAFLKTTSECIGIMLSTPFYVIEEVFFNIFERVFTPSQQKRLVRVDQFLHAIFLTFREAFQSGSTFQESGFADAIGNWLARTTWQILKRFGLIRRVLRVQTLEQLTALFVNGLKRRANLVLYVLVAIVTFCGMVWISTCYFCFCVLWKWPIIEKVILPQDSKRVYQKKYRAVRQNRVKPGPDTLVPVKANTPRPVLAGELSSIGLADN